MENTNLIQFNFIMKLWNVFEINNNNIYHLFDRTKIDIRLYNWCFFFKDFLSLTCFCTFYLLLFMYIILQQKEANKQKI